MPATVKRQGGKYRVVEPNGQLVRNTQGTPVDGGGHATREAAERQARAINVMQERKRR